MKNRELRRLLRQFDKDAQIIWVTNWCKNSNTPEVTITRCWYDPKEKKIMLGNPDIDEIKDLL